MLSYPIIEPSRCYVTQECIPLKEAATLYSEGLIETLTNVGFLLYSIRPSVSIFQDADCTLDF